MPHCIFVEFNCILVLSVLADHGDVEEFAVEHAEHFQDFAFRASGVDHFSVLVIWVGDAGQSFEHPVSLLGKFMLLHVEPIFEFHLQTLRDVSLSDFLVELGVEWVVNLVRVEEILKVRRLVDNINFWAVLSTTPALVFMLVAKDLLDFFILVLLRCLLILVL